MAAVSPRHGECRATPGQASRTSCGIFRPTCTFLCFFVSHGTGSALDPADQE